MTDPEESSMLAADGLHGARTALWGAAQDELPEPFDEDEELRLTGRRLLELAAEQCDAVEVLRGESLLRPAHSVLRGLLESMAYLVWISLDPDRYGALFWQADTPPLRNILERIGWEKEYELNYSLLSELVHPTESRLHDYREVDTGTADGLLPEVTPDGETYVLPGLSGIPYVSFSPMTREAAETRFGPYLRFKALDVSLAGLLAFFGRRAARSADWWPVAAAESLGTLLERREDFAEAAICRAADLLQGEQLDLGL